MSELFELKFRTADAAIRFQRAARERNGSLQAMDLRGMQGYYYAPACLACKVPKTCKFLGSGPQSHLEHVKKTGHRPCRSRKWHTKYEGKHRAAVCAACGAPWKVTEVQFAKNVFQGDRRYSSFEDAILCEASVAKLIRRAENTRQRRWAVRALLWHVGNELSLEDVARVASRRYPRYCADWSAKKVARLVREGRVEIERQLDRAGMLLTGEEAEELGA